MKHLRNSASCIIAAAFLFHGTKAFCKPLQSGEIGRIDSLMNAVYRRGQFSGAILVASQDKVLYEKAFGMANRDKQLPFTNDTREYIGSISKQFTAMGIMILKDRSLLNYDQSVRQFFPELPACMKVVTIRHLLYHTSGLALFDDYPNMTGKDVFNILLKQDSLRFKPGTKFEYCNAGYSLLGMIIEKVSGESFHDFMEQNIFKPLGMRHTQVNQISRPDIARAVGYTLFGNVYSYDSYMGGNVSIISTARDLYKWDEALYHFSLLKPQTLAEAFAPSAEVMKNSTLVLKDYLFGDKSYGFGWWITEHDGAKDMFHDGAFSGYTAYNERITADRIAIIEVTNLRQCPVYEIRNAIVDILRGKPYQLPKIPGSLWLNRETAKIGIDSAIARYRVLQNSANPDYDFAEVVLNSYAYILLRSGKVDAAIKIFKLNTEIYPDSFNVYDSLADGYEKAGDNAAALESCKKALAIDPSSSYMQQRITSLEKHQKHGD
jgi:CubicO group peptidase (beta-lactamase class C family)